jgi:hypothetical protein
MAREQALTDEAGVADASRRPTLPSVVANFIRAATSR